MSRKIKVTVLALMLSAATVASAQTTDRSQTFANQFRQFQNLSSSAAGTYTFHAAPALTGTAQYAVGQPSFATTIAALQAESSNSSQFKPRPALVAQAADPVGTETFAQAFALLQASSSNSGQYGFAPGSNVPAVGASSTLVQGKPIGNLLSWRSASRDN